MMLESLYDDALSHMSLYLTLKDLGNLSIATKKLRNRTGVFDRIMVEFVVSIRVYTSER